MHDRGAGGGQREHTFIDSEYPWGIVGGLRRHASSPELLQEVAGIDGGLRRPSCYLRTSNPTRPEKTPKYKDWDNNTLETIVSSDSA